MVRLKLILPVQTESKVIQNNLFTTLRKKEFEKPVERDQGAVVDEFGIQFYCCNEFRTQEKNYQDALIQQNAIALQQKEKAIVELIKKGDYDQAQTMSKSKAPFFPVLYSYAHALQYEKKGDHSIALHYWKEIPLDYNGLMST